MIELITVNDSLKKCFGILVEPQDNNSVDTFNKAFVSKEIYESVLNSLEESFGCTQALKFSVTPDSYLKYKDGNYSSMIRETSKGIKYHSGFEAINLIKVADSIYNSINANISNFILRSYSGELKQIFDEMSNRIEKDMNDLVLAEHLSEIESYKLFYEDLQDDFENIMVNPSRRMAYLQTIISKKTDIYKNFIFILNRLDNLTRNLNCLKNTPNANELINLLLNAHFLIDLNLYNGVYEYVLSGDYSKNYEKKILNRCCQMESQLKNVFKLLKTNLDNVYNWTSIFFNYSGTNGYYVTNCIKRFDENRLDFDFSKINSLQNEIATFLKNIQLIQMKS